MTTHFTQRLTQLIAGTQPQTAPELPFVRPAFEDTLAVAFAGWGEPVTRKVASQYPQGDSLAPDEDGPVEGEAAALIYGTAAHALDYDDVHQSSSTHPSAPIVAALAAAVRGEPGLAARATTAFAVGLAANVGLGRVLGFPHYEKGWHATSTIGPLAAAAAVAHLYGLDGTAAAHALAIAAAQSGGLQRNFGAMAKPLQAGLAGAAGLRAARLARAGVTADPDVFGPKGYFDLYRGEALELDPDSIEFDLHGGGIAVKLYPCCYQTHRPIAVGLAAREALQAKGLATEALADIEVIAPPGSFLPLRVQDPQVGSEGKFCGAYTVACALLDGAVGLAHFEDDAVHRPDVRALMGRIRMLEREGKPDGMKRRSSPLELIGRDAQGNELVHTQVLPFPGSPDSPPQPGQIEAKVRDCLAHYERQSGRRCSYARFQSVVDGLLAPARPMARAAAGD
jgi:2-methylcitrate dehydratase PrpD